MSKKPKQSIPDGSYCRINWRGHESELVEDCDKEPSWFPKMERTMVKILHLEMATELGRADYEYYNVLFKDGTMQRGLSGYYFEPMQRHEIFNELPEEAWHKWVDEFEPIDLKDRVEIKPDPRVAGVYAMQIKRKLGVREHPWGPGHYLYTHGAWEGVEYETWPPVSGDLKFY